MIDRKSNNTIFFSGILKPIFIGLFAFIISGCTALLGPDIGVVRTGENANNGTNVTISAGTGLSNVNNGRNEHANIISSYGGVYKNRKAEILVANIASSLLIAARQGNSSYTVTILDSSDVNAFALEGGYIFVTRGMLTLANSSSELAAVLAHEIAHVTLRHARARSSRTRTSEIVDKVITSVLGGDIETDQTAARSRLSLAAFSQSQELAADKEGIIIAAKAGYDAFAAARLLNSMGRFATLTNRQDDGGDDFLSTHPSTPNRIQIAMKSARFYTKELNINLLEDRNKYFNAINGLRFGASPNQGVIAGNKFIHPLLKFTFSVPKKYKLQNTPSALVAVAGEGEALRFDSAKVPISMSLTDYINSGWITGLKPNSVRLEKNQNGVEMAFGEAQTNQWYFRVFVIRFNDEVYRFIFAIREKNNEFIKATKTIVASFRASFKSDLAQIKKVKIAVVTATKTSTIISMVKRMNVINNAREVFLVLNNLYLDDELVAGKQYKIVNVE